MKKINNLLDVDEYIFWSLAATLSPYLLFINTAFQTLPGCSKSTSKLMLCLLIAAFFGLGFFFSSSRHRDCMHIFVFAVLPYGVFTLWAYWNCFPVLFPVVLGITAALSAGFVVLRMTRKIQNPQKRKRIIRNRLRQSFWGTQVISSFALACIVAVLCVANLFGFAPALMHSKKGVPDPNGSYSIEAQLENLGGMRNEVWETLNDDERLELLQLIADIEAQNLGLPKRLEVFFGEADKEVFAYYTDNQKRICVNEMYFHDVPGERMIETICHETYHGYERCLIDAYQSVPQESRNLLDLRAAEKYIAEFKDYKDVSEDFEAYYMQACEEDARDYGKERSQIYLYMIHWYFDDYAAEPTQEDENEAAEDPVAIDDKDIEVLFSERSDYIPKEAEIHFEDY